jgi:hypothetical protein
MHDIPELDRRGLREFGLVTGGILATLFGLFFPWLMGSHIPVWPWLVGGGLAIWALTMPASLRLIYRLWMQFGLLLNRITTPLILGVVFFLVIFPAALIMKLFRRDPLERAFDDQTESYRVLSHKAPNKNLEKPF